MLDADTINFRKSIEDDSELVLIIGGHARSGTSMLRELCNRHPSMTITHEFGTFCELGRPYTIYKKSLLKRWGESKFLAYRVFRSDLKNTRIRRWLRAFRGHIFLVRYLSRMRAYRFGRIEFPVIEKTLRGFFPNDLIIGDKWPEYVMMLNKLVPLMDQHDVKIVIIYRDCRDVTASTLNLVRTSWKHQAWVKNADTAEKVAQRWVNAIEMMEQHREKILTICYEELVRDSKTQLQRLADYLGVQVSGFPDGMIRNTKMGKYQSALTEDELASIYRVAGSTMLRLGYDVNPVHLEASQYTERVNKVR